MGGVISKITHLLKTIEKEAYNSRTKFYKTEKKNTDHAEEHATLEEENQRQGNTQWRWTPVAVENCT